MPRRVLRPQRGASTAERAAARARLGPLHSLLISPRMTVRYSRAVYRFIEMTSLLFVLSDDLVKLDQQLAFYLEWLWQEGEAKSLAADTICGLQHSLNIRRCFPGSWRLYGAWTRTEVPFRASPLPLEAVLAISGWLMAAGEVGAAALLHLWLQLYTPHRRTAHLGPESYPMEREYVGRRHYLALDKVRTTCRLHGISDVQ